MGQAEAGVGWFARDLIKMFIEANAVGVMTEKVQRQYNSESVRVRGSLLGKDVLICFIAFTFGYPPRFQQL